MERTDILRKVRALLARSDAERNDNAHEREVALRQATKLMDRYAIEMAEVHGSELGARGTDWEYMGRNKWRGTVFGTIAKLYGCVAYLQGDQVAVVGQTTHRHAAIDIATWVCESIVRERKARAMPRKEQQSWLKGAAAGVSTTAWEIMDARKGQGSTGTALVVVYDNEAQANYDWLAEQGIRLGKAKRASVRDWASFSDGKSYGSSINLGGQLSGAAGNTKLEN